MNLQKAISIVKELANITSLPFDSFIMGGSAVMVAKKLKSEMNDLDIYLVHSDWIKVMEFFESSCSKTQNGCSVKILNESVDFYLWDKREKETVEKLFGFNCECEVEQNHIKNSGFRTWTLQYLAAKKMQWNRLKDWEDLEILKKYLYLLK